MRLMDYWIIVWFIVREMLRTVIVMFFVMNRARAIVVFLCVGDGSRHQHQKR